MQILLIKADKLQSKMYGPLSGAQEGVLNSFVQKDRESATRMINFKYHDYVTDEGIL